MLLSNCPHCLSENIIRKNPPAFVFCLPTHINIAISWLLDVTLYSALFYRLENSKFRIKQKGFLILRIELGNRTNRQIFYFSTVQNNPDSLRFNSTTDEINEDKFLFPRVTFDWKRDKIMSKLSCLFCANLSVISLIKTNNVIFQFNVLCNIYRSCWSVRCTYS